MSCERTIDGVLERLKGLSSPEDDRALEAHLKTCSACREEAAAITALWSEMSTLEDAAVPRERMLARFHAALAAHEQRAADKRVFQFLERVWPRGWWADFAVAAGFLAVGIAVGQWLPSSRDREIAGLREEIRAVGVGLLDHQSASERLRGVELSRQLQPDARVVNLLLQTVRDDPSVNVRLAAVEALGDRLDRPAVGMGLADALANEDTPLIQITLARVLLAGNVDGAAAAVRRLLERNDLDPSVRDYLRAALVGPGDGTPPRPSSL